MKAEMVTVIRTIEMAMRNGKRVTETTYFEPDGAVIGSFVKEDRVDPPPLASEPAVAAVAG